MTRGVAAVIGRTARALVARVATGNAVAASALAVVAIAALAGCSGLRPAHPAASGESGSAGAVAPADVVTAPASPAPSEAADAVTAAHAENSAAVPVCTCADGKTKPRARPKPKPVRREAPPQLPTAPVVAQTPAGGVVNAQVRPLGASVMSILGKRVQGPNNEDLGRVVDVLADASGRVRVAIIDSGGFLGVGNHRIGVDWPLLRFNPDGSDPTVQLSISREKLGAVPEYKDTARPRVLMEPPAAAAPATEEHTK